MYALPKTVVLVSAVLTFRLVAVGTLLKLLCFAPYLMKLFQYAPAFRRLLSFSWFPLDLLFPFRKLPLITLCYALRLIVAAMNVCPSG